LREFLPPGESRIVAVAARLLPPGLWSGPGVLLEYGCLSTFGPLPYVNFLLARESTTRPGRTGEGKVRIFVRGRMARNFTLTSGLFFANEVMSSSEQSGLVPAGPNAAFANCVPVFPFSPLKTPFQVFHFERWALCRAEFCLSSHTPVPLEKNIPGGKTVRANGPANEMTFDPSLWRKPAFINRAARILAYPVFFFENQSHDAALLSATHRRVHRRSAWLRSTAPDTLSHETSVPCPPFPFKPVDGEVISLRSKSAQLLSFFQTLVHLLSPLSFALFPYRRPSLSH